MLVENHVCKVQSQYFKTMENQFLQSNMFADDCQLLMTLRKMFLANEQMCYAFATEAYKALIPVCQLKEDDFQAYYEKFATYGVLMSNFVMVYNPEEPAVTKRMALYTTSVSLMNNLASRGFLKGKKEPIEIELQNIAKTLYESDKIKKSLKDEGKVIAVRLDYEVFGGDKLVFKPTIPRSALDINKHIFIPLITMQEAQTAMLQILNDKVLRITYEGRVRTVTMNYQTLAFIYGQERANFLISGKKDAISNRFYIPSVGASIYTAGVSNIRLTEVDKIEVVNNITEIDLTEVKMNYAMVPQFFLKKVRAMEMKDKQKVAADLGVEDLGKNKTSANKALELAVRDMRNHEVWAYMKENDKLFNTAEYAQMPCKFGNDYIPITIPKTTKDLEDLLNVGIFKILVTKRDGSFSTIIGTNNSRELKRCLGKGYVKYESEGVRYRILRRDMEEYGESGQSAFTRDEFKEICKDYGLVECFYFDVMNNLYDTGSSDITFDFIEDQIRIKMNEIEANKTVVEQPHLVRVRSVEATRDADGKPIGLYKNVDPSCIVDMVCLHQIRGSKKA